MDTPLVAGLIRGIVAAILIGLLRALMIYSGVDGGDLDEAAVEGAKESLPILIGLTGWAGYDQWRAANGRVIASDVPIQIAASKTTKSAVQVAHDFAPSKLR